MLLETKLIVRDTALAVQADKSEPYATASKMMQPAIEKAKQDPQMHKALVEILKKFNLRV